MCVFLGIFVQSLPSLCCLIFVLTNGIFYLLLVLVAVEAVIVKMSIAENDLNFEMKK